MATVDQDVNFKITQGDTFSLELVYKDEDENIVDITGYSFLMQIKDKPGGKILSAECSIGDGIEVPNPADGTIIISVSPEKTNNFNYPRASYQIQGTDPYDDKITFLQGWFKVNAGTIN
jgi:hypothetical protein